jgi:hypothetical protein
VFTGFWLGGPKVRDYWEEDNIKMDLRETGIDGASWIRPVQDRAQWWTEHSNEPSCSIKKAGYCLTN